VWWTLVFESASTSRSRRGSVCAADAPGGGRGTIHRCGNFLVRRAFASVDAGMRRAIRFRLMAIRFQCAACSEPIEVDDHWARQVVRCPYCQRTVTAPGESNASGIRRIPIGKPLRRIIDERSGEESPVAPIAFPPPPACAAVPTNRAATAAFILACLMMGLLGLASW